RLPVYREAGFDESSGILAIQHGTAGRNRRDRDDGVGSAVHFVPARNCGLRPAPHSDQEAMSLTDKSIEADLVNENTRSSGKSPRSARRRRLLLPALAAFCLGPHASLSAGDSALEVTIRVVNSAGANDLALATAKHEAVDILKRADIPLVWLS